MAAIFVHSAEDSLECRRNHPKRNCNGATFNVNTFVEAMFLASSGKILVTENVTPNRGPMVLVGTEKKNRNRRCCSPRSSQTLYLPPRRPAPHYAVIPVNLHVCHEFSSSIQPPKVSGSWRGVAVRYPSEVDVIVLKS